MEAHDLAWNGISSIMKLVELDPDLLRYVAAGSNSHLVNQFKFSECIFFNMEIHVKSLSEYQNEIFSLLWRPYLFPREVGETINLSIA